MLVQEMEESMIIEGAVEFLLVKYSGLQSNCSHFDDDEVVVVSGRVDTNTREDSERRTANIFSYWMQICYRYTTMSGKRNKDLDGN